MDSLPNPIILLLVMVILSMAPFIAIMVSSFVKISVVIHLVRNALGIQQIPPNMAINGLAIILSVYIMAPVGSEIYDSLIQQDISLQTLQEPATQEALKMSIEPLRKFLKKHAGEQEIALFVKTTRELWPPEYADKVTVNDFLVLLPAFTVSQLTSAFQIGFMIYLPFLAIDLIVSIVLLAMGMMMVSPMTISMPFKLLLFVLVEGWAKLIHGLVLSYQ